VPRWAGDSSFDLFQLPEEHDELRAAIRALGERRSRRTPRTSTSRRAFPDEALKALNSAGFSAVHIPEKYGGQGADAVAGCHRLTARQRREHLLLHLVGSPQHDAHGAHRHRGSGASVRVVVDDPDREQAGPQGVVRRDRRHTARWWTTPRSVRRSRLIVKCRYRAVRWR
jgi:acyl-CoA dehydrogenase-like protein